MSGSLALVLVAAWTGFSLTLIVLTFIRLLAAAETSRRSPPPYMTRVLVFVFVAVGVFGYAGLVGNFGMDKNVEASVMLVGCAAGVWTSYLVFPKSLTKREG